MVAHLMGPDIGPYEGTVPELDAVDIDRLQAALGLPKTTLREALLAQTERRRFSTTFRHSRRCIAQGYRAYLVEAVLVRSTYRPFTSAVSRLRARNDRRPRYRTGRALRIHRRAEVVAHAMAGGRLVVKAELVLGPLRDGLGGQSAARRCPFACIGGL